MCCFIVQLFWGRTISWAKLIFLFIDFLLFVYHQNFSTNWFFSHYFRKSSNFVFSIFHVSQQTWIKKTINSTKISKKFFLISLCVVSFFNYFEIVPFHELSLFFYSLIFFFLCTIKTFPQIDFFLTISGNYEMYLVILNTRKMCFFQFVCLIFLPTKKINKFERTCEPKILWKHCLNQLEHFEYLLVNN